MTRCACGYPQRYHDPVSLRCPLCQCGSVVGAHGPYTTPPSILVRDSARKLFAQYVTRYRCPDRPNEMRCGTFREPAPEPKTTWCGLVVPAATVKARAPEDRVPRREAVKLDEIAPAGLKLGMRARNVGVDVVPYFRELHDGAWWTILRMERGAFRAIAIWRRPVGGKWAFLSAAVDRVPVGAKRLGELLSELGELGRS